MTVQELQPHTDVAPLWTDACPRGHGAEQTRGWRQVGVGSSGRPAMAPAGARIRPPTRSVGLRAAAPTTVDRVRPVSSRSVGTVRSTGRAPVSPGRRVPSRPAAGARACHIEAPSPVGVVDDVPTWALLTCGIVVGVLMLLALAFLGGPAYA